MTLRIQQPTFQLVRTFLTGSIVISAVITGLQTRAIVTIPTDRMTRPVVTVGLVHGSVAVTIPTMFLVIFVTADVRVVHDM